MMKTGRHDWYRNTDWNEEIEAFFETKLKRARKKDQFLRIQACMLAKAHPEVALRLLDRYFELDDPSGRAQGFVDRATALLALGRLEEAILAYLAAIDWEAGNRCGMTRSFTELPYLVAVNGVRERYDQVLGILAEPRYQKRLLFECDVFFMHAAQALIAADRGEAALAAEHAREAVAAAAAEHSGLRYHPNLGLVGNKFPETMRRLKALL